MKLVISDMGPANLIRSYGDGAVQVGERRFDSALLLGARLLVTDLRPQSPAEIEERDLDALLAASPVVMLIGWAGGQTFLNPRQRGWFAARRVGVEVMELGAACRTYNVLVGDGREVSALMFPRKGT